ncbi:MAG: sigma-54 dependent transcriptional regulator [Gemmatimonadetes bacterium]|nr:sigma-54 dependent transcriptional regulator [Gemmatimonadota bacterium]
MARSPIPLHVAVFGPAAEYVDLVPSEESIECVFVHREASVGDPKLSPLPRFVVLDLDYVGEEVDRILAELNALSERPRVVAVTRDPSTDSAVHALTAGADEYCILPRDRERIGEAVVETKLELWGNGDGTSREGPITLLGFPDMIARCEAMRGVLGVVRKVIESGARTVLIRGETGTGKELVARAIHYQSAQHDQPFIEVNCTAIPENLLEAELFGYEKGAFTDAKSSKPGLLQLADGGTLFLDELGDMSLNLQGKLLRAIEEKRFRRLGGTREVSVSMRIIAATSRDLEQAIGQGLFRSDLYYRLNVVAVELPPLRERGDDVELLAEHFAARYAEQYGKPDRPLSKESREFLHAYSWPGNIRELKNTIERAVLLGEGPRITLPNVAGSDRSRRTAGDEVDRLVIELPPEGLPFDEFERQVIAHALERNEWNKSQTARELEISRPRLLRKIDKYDLEPAETPS